MDVRRHLPGAVLVADAHHHRLDVGEARGHPQAPVVAVTHDEPADHPGGGAPRRGPAQLLLAVGVEVLDVEGLGEVLAQLVAGAHLQGLAVAHHGLARHGVDGAGEAVVAGLDAEELGHGEHVHHEVGVGVVQDPGRVGAGVGLGGVGGVALLPEELGGPQEQPGSQLPAHDVAPHVQQQRQVAVALGPLGHELADDRLGRGPHDDGLLELLATAVGDHGQLGAEPLDVVGLAGQVALGDEEGEVGVLGAAGLDAVVHLALHALPQPVAVGPDDHRAPHRPVVGQLRLVDDVLVPPGEVVRLGGEHGCLGHDRRLGPGARPDPKRPLWLRSLPMGSHIRYEVDDGVATITIDRPEKRNAMTYAVLADFTAAVWRAADDDAARVVIITGAGGAFCAGTDLSDLDDTPEDERGTRAGAGPTTRGRACRGRIVQCPKPVIAAVDGAAVGMGVEFATQCDVRIASDRARFGWVFVQAGPGARHRRRQLPPPPHRRAHRGAAPAALRRGHRRRRGRTRIGFVSAGRRARRPAGARPAPKPSATSTPRRSPSPAPSASCTRRWRRRSPPTPAQTGRLLQECFHSEDHAEGVASFLERRPARFTGR